ncbi:retrovirus-related pol polyprotein from transposon TNT 1-94 [Tanacetum coccineum]|uniref:Retrovirus-related pol polyprotein from transposon TNT 1-94 n=1 Tax=Tanacetum coccineum TaxID=301880 RepID=A0ABQ4YQM0_9ASTR
MQDKSKERCMVSFRVLHSHLTTLSNNDLKGTSTEGGFKRVFATLFEQDVQTFTRTMFVNLDQLENIFPKKNFNNFNPLVHLEYSCNNFRQGNVDSSKALDAGSVVTESNETESERHVSSSRSNKDAHVEDANINSVNDKQPMAELQLTTKHNILANEQWHYEQSESIYDTYLSRKVDRNTTLDSTDMSHRGGEIDQHAVKCQVSCPLLDPSFDNMTTEFSNQSLESENISLKKTVAQLQKDFSRMKAHCVNMELKYQNQVLKNGQHESSVARLLAENEKLNKENEHLKQTYKDLSDSIKKTSVHTKDHADSLIVQLNCKSVENVDLKAQIQKKVFANAALKNELRKIKGTSVDTNSNDMAYNYYLEEAKKKTQDKNGNLKPRKIPSARTHHSPNTCIPKPRSNNQTSRNSPASKSSEEMLKAVQKADHSRNPSSFLNSKHFVCSTCQKWVFNANHDAYITKFLKEVNSRVKVQSPKTRNSNKLVEPKIYTQKHGKQIATGHRFSPNKSSDVHEKINTLRSCLRWIPTGRIFNTVGLSSSEPALHEMTPVTISSGLVPNPPPSTPVDRPTIEVIAPIAKVVAPEPAASTGSPSSTTIDQDAPSPNVAHMDNNPFFGIPIPEHDSESYSSDVIPTIVHTAAPNSEHVNKWTKDHPLDNIIGKLRRPVSTRLQLYKQALFCYYDAFLSSVEPKTYKDALTQSCWIEAMQEGLNEFECHEVWELVPHPDKVMVITLKWIYKVKLDEMGGIMKNKARLVARGYRQEEGIDFEENFAPVARLDEFSKGTVDPTLFIRRQGKDILLSKYALESLKKYGMKSSDPVDTPMVEKSKVDEDPQGKAVDPTNYHGMVGTLMYLTASRIDLTFVKSVAISSLEAEYIALSGCCAQVLWMRSQLTNYDIRFHFIKEQVENGVVELYFVNIEYQLTDIFTKALCIERIEFIINKLGMRSFTPETLKQLAYEAEE